MLDVQTKQQAFYRCGDQGNPQLNDKLLGEPYEKKKQNKTKANPVLDYYTTWEKWQYTAVLPLSFNLSVALIFAPVVNLSRFISELIS